MSENDQMAEELLAWRRAERAPLPREHELQCWAEGYDPHSEDGDQPWTKQTSPNAEMTHERERGQ